MFRVTARSAVLHALKISQVIDLLIFIDSFDFFEFC